MGQKKHRLVGLKKIDTGVDTSGKQVQNTAGPGTDRSRSKSPEESIESIKQGARELALSVSAICEKNGKKLAYVTFTDGEKKAEGEIPECIIRKNTGFTQEEVEQLQNYMQRELPMLKKTAAGIRLFDAFRK